MAFLRATVLAYRANDTTFEEKNRWCRHGITSVVLQQYLAAPSGFL